MEGPPISLTLAMLRAREAMMRQLRPILAEHGVTEPQWRLLRVLQVSGALEITQLCRYACMLPASVSRILVGLQEAGYTTRTVPEADRRRSLIDLSTEGRVLIERILPLVEANTARIAEVVGEADISELHERLARFTLAIWAEGIPD